MAPNNSEPDSKAAKRFLKAQATRGGSAIRWATGLALAGGLLVIASAWLLAKVVDDGLFRHANLQQSMPYLGMLLGVYALRALLVGAAEYQGHRAAIAVKASLRQALLTNQLQVRQATASGGTVLTTLVEGLDALHGYYARYLPAMATSAMVPLAILCFVLPVDRITFFILLVTGPLVTYFMILIGQGTESLNRKQWGTLTRLGEYCFDRIQGLTTLKLFGASRREGAMIACMGETYRRETMAVLRIAFLSSAALEFFSTVSIAMVAVLVGFRLLWGEVPFDRAYLVLLLAPEFFLPLRRLGTHYHARMEAMGAVDALRPLLEVEPFVQGIVAAPQRPCQIVGENVSAEYVSGEPVVQQVSFAVQAGEHLALAGPSGSGKSTLLALMLGLIEPTEGRILIDGAPLADIDLERWWQSIGWVPQRPSLFSGDVRSNILLSAPAHTSQHVDALAQALCIDFLDQPTGERGAGLSGGQVQRVAMARALIRQSHLLLMDEPTAGLDSISERLIERALPQWVQGATRITAAHRLHTLTECDRILLLEKGRVADQGNHTELLARSAYYHDCLTVLEAV